MKEPGQKINKKDMERKLIQKLNQFIKEIFIRVKKMDKGLLFGIMTARKQLKLNNIKYTCMITY